MYAGVIESAKLQHVERIRQGARRSLTLSGSVPDGPPIHQAAEVANVVAV